MYEGEDKNTIDLLHESDTDAPNGVKITVPVKDNDRGQFGEKIRQQLAYFENVYFDVKYIQQGWYSKQDEISNDFSIYRGDDFQWSELIKDENLHICLDNVYYPIDFDKLGIHRIELPIGLKFNLTDGVFPTINRESIRYTQEAKAIILKKIKDVADYFVNEYNNNIKETDDIIQIFKFYENDSRLVNIQQKSFRINPIIKYSSTDIVTPKLKGVELLNLKELSYKQDSLVSEYSVGYVYDGIRMSSKIRHTLHSASIDDKHYYIYSDNISGKKKNYLRDVLYGGDYYFIRKVKTRKLWESSRWERYDNYYTILSLKNFPRQQWRQVIKEFHFIQKKITDKFINLDNLEIPKSWDEQKKRERAQNRIVVKRNKPEGHVNCKVATYLERYMYGRHCKFISDTLDVSKLHRHNKLSVYTSHDDAISKLDPLYGIGKGQLRMLSFSKRELKKVEEFEIHNLIPYEEFMKGKNKPFKRIVTAYLINKLISKYSRVFSRTNEIKPLIKDFANKLNELHDYSRKYYVGGGDTLHKVMLQIAEDNNLFDTNIYSTYLEVKEKLDKLYFIDVILGNKNGYNTYRSEDFDDLLRDMFKYYKVRMEYTNYKLPVKETKEELIINN